MVLYHLRYMPLQPDVQQSLHPIKNENQKENMDSDFREHNAGDGGRKILYGAKLTGTSDSDSKGDYGRLWSFLEDSTGGER